MSILVPLVSSGITMNEIPGRIAVYFELGNCTQGCPGCHSPHLSEQQVLAITPLEELESIAETQATKGANAIVLMGGTTNGISDDDAEHDKTIAQKSGVTWLKTGSYQEERGGLSSPSTNQRFYKLTDRFVADHKGNIIKKDTIFHDLTHLFQKGVP